jgi:hypothetical protein
VSQPHNIQILFIQRQTDVLFVKRLSLEEMQVLGVEAQVEDYVAADSFPRALVLFVEQQLV